MTILIVNGPPGAAFKVFLPKGVLPVPLPTPGEEPGPKGPAKPYVEGRIGTTGQARVTLTDGVGEVALIADGYQTARVDVPSTGSVEHTLER